MELFTFVVQITDKLLSVPVNQVTAFGEGPGGRGLVYIGKREITSKEDYQTLTEMWKNLTDTED